MSLIKWNPANSMEFFRDFDSMFEDFFRSPSRIMQGSETVWTPRIDVLEKEKEYHLIAELPGMDKKDIDITVKDDVLTISGEKKAEEKQEDQNYYSCERRYGKFERSFRMAGEVDVSNVKAEYKNGVLTLSVPKIEKPEPASTQIQIK